MWIARWHLMRLEPQDLHVELQNHRPVRDDARLCRPRRAPQLHRPPLYLLVPAPALGISHRHRQHPP